MPPVSKLLGGWDALQQKFAHVRVVSAVSSAVTWDGSKLVTPILQRRWEWRAKIAMSQEL